MLLFYMSLEMYRSGYNENDSKSFWLLKATWVRIPPSPPNKNLIKIKKHKKINLSCAFLFFILILLIFYYITIFIQLI